MAGYCSSEVNCCYYFVCILCDSRCSRCCCRFLPRDAVQARPMLSSGVRLSVCLSVCLSHCLYGSLSRSCILSKRITYIFQFFSPRLVTFWFFHTKCYGNIPTETYHADGAGTIVILDDYLAMDRRLLQCEQKLRRGSYSLPHRPPCISLVYHKQHGRYRTRERHTIRT